MNGLERRAYQTGEVVGKPPAQLEMENGRLTPEEQTILWANQVLEKYKNLLKGNIAERSKARGLVRQTAKLLLLGNPQDIDAAVSVWNSRGIKEEQHEDNQKTKSFYDLVKQEVLRDIIGEWKTTPPRQFVQLVRGYEGSVLMQEIFDNLPAEHIRRPQRTSQLLTVQEASELLEVHSNTLRRWGAKGILKPVARLGKRGDRRYGLDDVTKLINRS